MGGPNYHHIELVFPPFWVNLKYIFNLFTGQNNQKSGRVENIAIISTQTHKNINVLFYLKLDRALTAQRTPVILTNI